MNYKNIDVLNGELKKRQYTTINKNEFPDQKILHNIVLAFHDDIIPLYDGEGKNAFTEDATAEHYYANYYVDLFHKLYCQCSMIPKDTEELVSDKNNYLLMKQDNFVVFLESHQNKHQRLAIGQLLTYTGASGNKFPEQCNITWHQHNTCRVVLGMMQKACKGNYLSETNSVYIPKKEPIDNIIYDVVCSYDPIHKIYIAWYHCYPTDNFKV